MTHKILLRNLMVVLLLTGLSACTFLHTPEPYLPNKAGIEPGETITVKGEENVYAIAHEHNVSMRELIVLNDLKPPFEIKPGQSLVLPANGSSFAGDLRAPESSPLEPVEVNPLPPVMPAAVTSETLQTPQVQNVQKPNAVQSLNRPSPPPQQAQATTEPADDADDMRWPVQGPVLSGFGAKSGGVANDGVNIGAPKGAPVVAAASGTVVYAGNDMKGFGNLVLIKHEGDIVTAYAHLDRVLVKKDSVVNQGNMIGTVGKTGNVASPQLHFEVREGGKAVDPAKMIKKN